MANALLLDDYLLKTGKTKTHLARKLNVSRPTIYYLLKHPERCTYEQVETLCKELEIVKKPDRNDIFCLKSIQKGYREKLCRE